MSGFGGDLAYTMDNTAAGEESENSSAPDYVFEQQSSAQKTPISYLQEICTRRAMKPEYELLSTEGHVHEPTFMYRVTVSDLSAIGQGKSKRAAKHIAAKELLERMVATGRFKDFGMGDTSSEATETLSKLTDIITSAAATKTSGGEEQSPNGIEEGDGASAQPAAVSPAVTEDGGENGPGNPVGRLQEMCMQRKWSTPAYEVVKEEGAPHERSFVVKVIMGTRTVEGSSRSKKGAKRDAAEKMLRHLEKHPLAVQGENIGISEEDELAEQFVRAMVSLGHNSIKPITADAQQRANEFYETLKQEHSDCFNALRGLSLITTSFDYAQLLDRIGKNCAFQILYLPSEERSSLGEHQCLVQLDVKPVAVCYGKGATEENARQAAAHNALEYLKLATKK